jgi:MFS family permease
LKKLRAIDYFNINAYWFGLAFMWNSLHPIILPAILLNFVPERLKNTYLGGLTFLGLILAMIVQPIAGAISDRSTFRWGRRRLYILIGTLFDFVFLAVLGLAGNYWVLVRRLHPPPDFLQHSSRPCPGFHPRPRA